MRKKILVFILAVLSAVCFTLFACGEEPGSQTVQFEAAFKVGVKTEITIDESVNLESYIVKVDGATYLIKVTYKDAISGIDVSEKFLSTGNNFVFYPSNLGEHVITYEVTLNGETKSNTFKFNVVNSTVVVETEQAVEGVANTYSYRATEVKVEDGKVTSVTLPKGDINYDLQDIEGNPDITDNLAYVGATGVFGEGYTVKVNFTGKNLPGIAFLLDNAEEGSVIGHATGNGTGIFLENGAHSSDGINSALAGRLYACAPYRAQGNEEAFSNYGYAKIPYTNRRDKLSNYNGATTNPDYASLYPTENQKCPVGYKNLQDDKDYSFEVTAMTLSTEELKLKYVLFDVDNVEAPYRFGKASFFGNVHQVRIIRRQETATRRHSTDVLKNSISKARPLLSTATVNTAEK